MKRTFRFRIWTPLAALAVVAVGTLWFAPAGFGPFAQGQAPGPVFVDDGHAIAGYDPVAYFTEGRPVQGDARFEAEWNEATWRFASAENRDRFLAEPEAYAPQYGGYCAWAVAAKGELYAIDPHAWNIVDGRLYLNYSAEIQRRWEQDVPGFIERADRRWPEIISAS